MTGALGDTTAIDAQAPEECICPGMGGEDGGCACLPAERALRAIARGDFELTDLARTWCLDQIGSVEGYSRTDYQDCADRHIAAGVLSAWADYCRDKGLL